MECEKIREKFSSLLEGDLDPSEEGIVTGHLASCSGCQKDFETFKKTMNWLHSVEELEAPKGFLTETYQKIEDRKRMESRHGWVQWLSRMNLPAQAVAMVAIVFVVLYITKMISMETTSPKKVDKPLAYDVPSEKKTDAATASKEFNEKGSVEQKRAEPEETSMAELKPPPPEEKKVNKIALSKESPAAATIPAQEIIVKTPDQEKTLSELQGLVKEFGGEIVKEEGHILLASLPAGSISEFKKEMEQRSMSKRTEAAAPQREAPRVLKLSPKDKETAGGKEKGVGQSMAHQEGRITVRILVIKE